MTSFDWQFPYPSQRMPVLARNAVATSQPLAAQAGLAMLLKGGNAVDAALAAAITLTVVEPTSNGIGSDAFAILWDGTQLHGLNASGRSPAAWEPRRFADRRQMPTTGWDAVTVPGAVSAWVMLSQRFGKLPFADLFAFAIRYAADGYMVSPTIARLWSNQVPHLRDVPGFAEHFLPRGRAPQAGEKFVAPAHARTLARIAETNGEAFYRGDLAEKMVAHSRQHGGVLAFDDLAAHAAEWVEPLAHDYRGYTLHEIPPNGQGIAAQMALGILEEFDLSAFSVDSADSLHLQMEAMKLAFADIYAYVSDPATMPVQCAALLDKQYLRSRARLIDMNKAQNPGHGVPGPGGTVYLTAADASGMMVSYIQSNFHGFGSGVVVDGISMQDRGSGFVLQPRHPNEVGPRKRPFHTIIPAFITQNGQPVMSFGVMGGSMQAQGHTQVMTRFVDYRQNPQAASDAPRWRLLQGLDVDIEQGMPADVMNELTRRGHNLRPADRWATTFGRAQLICRMEDGYLAASERRTDGQAVGF
ncbi:MAG: gamma-glutamyltransferase family protein [Hyphomicrobiales bacterium]|nr:gamma-glutamyltransferase family protein [Hyphomicrobiales bacterium]MBV8824913.1 gamma-glutamyltransferase family protein [Hyphomicrobiales bacterium]MBV9429588.1 gamma-glutamyltransferase family protein [Bradyrhizobiaceae bacterium]